MDLALGTQDMPTAILDPKLRRVGALGQEKVNLSLGGAGVVGVEGLGVGSIGRGVRRSFVGGMTWLGCDGPRAAALQPRLAPGMPSSNGWRPAVTTGPRTTCDLP